MDDGWWSGRVLSSGQVGTFASLMVRELSAKEVSRERTIRVTAKVR